MRIKTPEELLAALIIEESSIEDYAAPLGLTAKDITDCTEQRANLQVALGNVPTANAWKKSVTEKKDFVYKGDSKSAIGQNPTIKLTDLPYPDALGNAYGSYNSRRTRAMASGYYTIQIGEDMGYENPKTDAPIPSSVKPTLDVFPAAINYQLSAVVHYRALSNQWELQMRRKGEENWTTLKTATGKSVDVTIIPTNPGQPEQIELRVILYKNNQIYGQPSDSVYATLNP